MAQARDAVLREVGTLAARATEGAYIRELNPEASIARQLAFVQFDGLPPGSFATLASLLSEEFGIPENEFISYRHSAYGGRFSTRKSRQTCH